MTISGAATASFAPNESSTYGMLVTLRKNNLAGRLKFVGFDASPELIDALKKGEIQGLVVQNPFRMGYDRSADRRGQYSGQGCCPANRHGKSNW